jgi:hypothetical protein
MIVYLRLADENSEFLVSTNKQASLWATSYPGHLRSSEALVANALGTRLASLYEFKGPAYYTTITIR